MKVTMKSINANLPRLDALRRNYAPLGTTGYQYWRLGYLSAAVADIDEANRKVTDITIYTYGDAMKASHYYGGGIDITDCIEEALRDPDITRRDLILNIQNTIEESLEDQTDEQ